MRSCLRRAFSIGCGLALLALAGCINRPPPEIQYPDYYVGAPDVLEVSILPEPRILQTSVVRNDGKITVELVGDVQAGGRTTQEIAEEIEQRISRYKRGAVVTVAVSSTESPTITVLGEVAEPQTIPLRRQMRVSEAIGVVGDVTLYSSPHRIRVIRGGDPTQEITVNLWEIRGGNLSSDVQLYAGDIIYVPSSVIARIGYAFQILLFPFQPLINPALTVLY